jgi:uncharacterized protein
MQSYRISSFLRAPAQKPLIYHSLFGNLSKVSNSIKQFLTECDRSVSEEYLNEKIGVESREYLYASYFLVSQDEDEREITQRWLNERQERIQTGYYFRTLQISASNLCNFACAYCFADASDARSSIRTKISKETPTLDVKTAQEGIDWLLKNSMLHGNSTVGVKFLGREPLVNWKTIRTLLEHYKEKGLQWSITTNGALITKEIAEILSIHKVRVVVSLDGPPITNNKLRVFKDGEGTFDAVVRGLEQLRATDVHFSISSVISESSSLDPFKQFIVNMMELGVTDFEFTLAMQTKQHLPQQKFASRDALISFLRGLYVFGTDCGASLHGDWADPFYRIRTTSFHRGDYDISRPLGVACSASEHQLSLESNGEVFPCRAMSTHYGTVSDLQSVISSQQYADVLMRTFYNVPACRGCQLEGHCQGTCLGSCEESSGSFLNPQGEYCNLYRSITDSLLETL